MIFPPSRVTYICSFFYLLDKSIAVDSQDGKIDLPLGYTPFHTPVSRRGTPMEVQLGIVITHVVELNFEKSYITLNVEFLMRWKDELVKLQTGGDDLHLTNDSMIWT